jgi:hypothetical protein
MDAVAYFKAYARMCDSFDSKNNITGKPCVGCPLDDIGRGCHMNDLTNNAESAQKREPCLPPSAGYR